MCGRFVGFRNIEQLKQYFPIDQAQCEVTANCNVAPTQEILVLLRRNGINTLEKYHWLDSANQDTAGLLTMLSERTITDLVFRPVSRQVNSPRTNDPGNIQPVQLELEF